jgi:hypothetical protein
MPSGLKRVNQIGSFGDVRFVAKIKGPERDHVDADHHRPPL